MDWREFQQLTAQLFRQLGCDARTDYPVEGVRAKHNIDVWVTFKSHGLPVSWAVECKLWKARVKKAQVLTLRSIVEDVGADKGIVVSQNGFQKGAVDTTRKTNISLVSPDDLRGYLADHMAGLEHQRGGEKSRRTEIDSPTTDLDQLPPDAPASAHEPYLLWSHNQTVQKATARRLVQVGGTSAVLLLARRLLNPWGVGAIESTEKALGRLDKDGGALVISALLLSDARFYYGRLEILLDVLRRRGDAESQAVVAEVLHDRIPDGMHFAQKLVFRLSKDIGRLRAIPCLDIAMGVEISAWYCSASWVSVVQPSAQLEVAMEYVKQHLPKLLDVLQQIDLSR